MKTIYMMRLWQDGSVSVIYNGVTLAGALRFVRDVERDNRCRYDGRHWIAATPQVKPAPDPPSEAPTP